MTYFVSHISQSLQSDEKPQAILFHTGQIQSVEKIGIIFRRIVTQRNAKHEKRTRVGKVKYRGTSLFCGERGSFAVCRIF